MLSLIFIGNLTAAPSVRTVQGNKMVCTFTVAVNRKTREGDSTTFINVTTWEKRAENCAKYLDKGRKVCVSVDFSAGGNVVAHAYNKKDGNAAATLEVTASSVEFISSRSESHADAPVIDAPSGFATVDETLPF